MNIINEVLTLNQACFFTKCLFNFLLLFNLNFDFIDFILLVFFCFFSSEKTKYIKV